MVEWCVIVYDKPGADRGPYRPTHLAGIPPLVEQGKLVNAGAIYHDLVDGKPANFAGSNLTVVADTKEEVLEILNNDIFAKEGVWDMSTVKIFPFGCAARKEKI